MHFPSWVPMCPWRICSSRFVIFFSRCFIPAFVPKMVASVSLNRCLFHSSCVGVCGSLCGISGSGVGLWWLMACMWCGVEKTLGMYWFEWLISMSWYRLTVSSHGTSCDIALICVLAKRMIPVFVIFEGHNALVAEFDMCSFDDSPSRRSISFPVLITKFLSLPIMKLIMNADFSTS